MRTSARRALLALAAVVAVLATGLAPSSAQTQTPAPSTTPSTQTAPEIAPSASWLDDGKIIDGTLVSQGTYPWVAYVRGAQGACTGTLITAMAVLTAAHCLKDGPAQYVIVNAADAYNPPAGHMFNVRSVGNYTHPSYAFPLNDIAVLHLVSPVPSAVATPLTLPTSPMGVTDIEASGPVRAIGYGKYNTDTTLSVPDGKLRTITAQVRNNESSGPCKDDQDMYGEDLNFTALSRLCVYRPEPGVRKNAVCFGDSGGPLIATTPQGPQLVGVLSASSPGGGDACMSWTYAQYTHVGPYQSWVLNQPGAGRLLTGTFRSGSVKTETFLNYPQLRIEGLFIDLDTADRVRVRVRINDGASGYEHIADAASPFFSVLNRDLEAMYGNRHLMRFPLIPLPRVGSHTVCVEFYDYDAAGNALGWRTESRGCQKVIAGGKPVGNIELTQQTYSDTSKRVVRVTGWALDPDRELSPASIRLVSRPSVFAWVASTSTTWRPTDLDRPDVRRKFGLLYKTPGYAIATSLPMFPMTTCLWVRDVAANNTVIGEHAVACRNV